MRRRLAVLALLAALPAHAGETIDLTPWLGVVPEISDTRAYEFATGASLTEVVESVEPHGRGWRIVTRIDSDWHGFPTTSRRVEVVVPGKRAWEGTFGTAGKLSLRARLLAAIPGDLATRRHRTRLEGFHQTLVERARVVGFEALETPALSFPSVLRVDTERAYRRRQNGSDDRGVVHARDWYLAAVGWVASEWSEPITGVPDWWLVSARINGVVLPAEEP